MTFDMHLRGKNSAAVLADREVNVGGPELVLQRVGNGLNGAEVILASRVGEESSIALEVAIASAGI